MMTGALFYFPTMHPEYAPASLPEGILFVPCGLSPLPADAHPAVRAFTEALPFAPREAAQILSDMLATAAERGIETLKTESLRPEPPNNREELAAVKTFAETGKISAAAAPTPEQDLRAERVAMQKRLLLAYSLEEQIAEIRKVEKRLRRSEEALAAALREEPGPESAMEQDFPPPDRRQLRAMAVFLPRGAALYADDPAVVREWQGLTAFSPAGDILLDSFPMLRDTRPLVGFLKRADLGLSTSDDDTPGPHLTLFIPAEGAGS